MPLARVKTYLPYDRCAFVMDADLEHTSMKRVLNQRPETRICKVKRQIEALMPNKEDISVLGIENGCAVQKVTTVRYNDSGNVVDISYAHYRGDMNVVEVEVIYPHTDE